MEEQENEEQETRNSQAIKECALFGFGEETAIEKRRSLAPAWLARAWLPSEGGHPR